MTLSGADAFFYTLAFLVPGFIVQTTISAFVPRKSADAQISLIHFLTLSCTNYGLWSWLIYLALRGNWSATHPCAAAFTLFWVTFAGPVIVGAVVGHSHQRDQVRRVLQRLGFDLKHGIPTAWDYKFSRTDPVWVLVTLKDGSTVAGWFGSNSFASSEPAERDLYVEEVYRAKGDTAWERVQGSHGILLRGDVIKHVEFMKSEEKMNDAEREAEAPAPGGLPANGSEGVPAASTAGARYTEPA